MGPTLLLMIVGAHPVSGPREPRQWEILNFFSELDPALPSISRAKYLPLGPPKMNANISQYINTSKHMQIDVCIYVFKPFE